MTTTTDSQAQLRKEKALTVHQRLRSEREQILSRQQATQATIDRLNRSIVQAERSNEADMLTKLRADRRGAEEIAEDLQRTESAINREIKLTEGGMVAAERGCASEAWNRYQVEQAALLQSITEAVELIANSINEKEKLAHRQLKILKTVLPGADLNADLLRHDLAFALTAALQGNSTTSLRAIDWTAWPLSEQGVLLR